MLNYFVLLPKTINAVEQNFMHRNQHFTGQTICNNAIVI